MYSHRQPRHDMTEEIRQKARLGPNQRTDDLSTPRSRSGRWWRRTTRIAAIVVPLLAWLGVMILWWSNR
jgi:hypothetical protein